MRLMQIIAVNPAVHANAEEPLMGPRVMLPVAATAWCLTWGAGESARPLFEFRPADDPSALRHDESWFANRVAAWQPTAQESAFDRIGWVNDLREAQRISRLHKRPMFLFTYDGTSLSGYRC
jgi:hypothetical protein